MKKEYIVFLVVLLLVAGIVGVLTINKGQRIGSVSATNEYTATTTPSGTGAWSDQLLDLGRGSLGSVIITKAGNTEFVLYNATSTGAIANDSRFVKSKQQLARITENLAAGVYTFDVAYTQGLVMDVERGTTGTSTITYRK